MDVRVLKMFWLYGIRKKHQSGIDLPMGGLILVSIKRTKLPTQGSKLCKWLRQIWQVNLCSRCSVIYSRQLRLKMTAEHQLCVPCEWPFSLSRHCHHRCLLPRYLSAASVSPSALKWSGRLFVVVIYYCASRNLRRCISWTVENRVKKLTSGLLKTWDFIILLLNCLEALTASRKVRSSWI